MPNLFSEEIRKAADSLNRYGAREVFLFGSHASGCAQPDSDIDLAVSGLPPNLFFTAMGELGDILKCSVDLIGLDEKNLFTQYLKDHGELIRVE